MSKDAEGFKYEVIARRIKDAIREGQLQENDRIPGEIELAQQFMASRITVRKAMELLESERLVYKIQGSGTYVAGKKADRPKSCNIAVLTSYITDYVFTNILRGIEAEATKEGYTISIGITEFKYSKEAQFIKAMIEGGVDGLIIESTLSALPNPNMDLYRQLDSLQIPYIFVNSYYKELNPVYVVTDDESVGFQAVDYLFDLGHRKIAGIFKMDEIQGLERYRGFLKGFKEHDLPVPEDHVWWFTTDTEEEVFSPYYDDFTGRKLEGCTAVVCYSDLTASKVMKYFERKGIRVPEDISIVGIDNSSISELQHYGITTFAHPKERLGIEAAKRLFKMIKTNERADSLTLRMHIVKRESARPIQ
ncbi:GntR family transcriptional regulator [Enterocloster aldenensis]|uniref:GntR family transcriptional regulator n=1 Tax=Enterocloster aldenensis TaxID=358742 RepID=UPI0040254507